jgi:hypothetical protein
VARRRRVGGDQGVGQRVHRMRTLSAGRTCAQANTHAVAVGSDLCDNCRAPELFRASARQRAVTARGPVAQEAAMSDFGTPGSFPAAPVPPSHSSRSGPPWEQPGAFVSRWIDTAKLILGDPMNGFSQVRRTGGLGAPLTYYFVGSSIILLGVLLLNVLGLGLPFLSEGGVGGGLFAAGGVIVIMLFVVVAIVIGFFVYAGFVHLILSLLGGANHGFEATARTFAYAQGSVAPLAFIPVCGGLAGLYGFFVAIMGLSRMHDTTPVKAAVAALSPGLLCCVLWVVMMVFGLLAGGVAGGLAE